MAEARAKDEWARTSTLMALLANCHRDPKKTRALRPSDFDPFAQRAEPVIADMADLKTALLEGWTPRRQGNETGGTR